MPSWKPLVLVSDEWLRGLWVRCQQVPLAWHSQWGTVESFGAWLMRRDSMFFAVEEGTDLVGIVYAERVMPGLDAWFGLIMLDRQIRGREAPIHEILTEMFKMAGLARMSMLTPRSREVTAKLARRLGFRHEGTMRRAYRTKGGVFEDCDLFGIIVEDLWRFEHRTAPGASPNGGGVLGGDEDAREVCTRTLDRIVDELDPTANSVGDRIDEGPDADGGTRGDTVPGSE